MAYRLSKWAEKARSDSIAKHISVYGRPNAAAATFDQNVKTAINTAELDKENVYVKREFRGYKWKAGRKSWRTSPMTEQLIALPTGVVRTRPELRHWGVVAEAKAEAARKAAAAAASVAAADAAKQLELAKEAAEKAAAEKTATAEIEAAAALERAKKAAVDAAVAAKKSEALVKVELAGRAVPPYSDVMKAAAAKHELPMPGIIPAWAQEHDRSLTVYLPAGHMALWPWKGYKENKRVRKRWFKYRVTLQTQFDKLPETYSLAIETLRLSMEWPVELFISTFTGAARSWYIRGGARRTLFEKEGGKALESWIKWMGWTRIPIMMNGAVKGKERHRKDIAAAKAAVDIVAGIAVAIVGAALLKKLQAAGIAETPAEAEAAVAEEVGKRVAEKTISEKLKGAEEGYRGDAQIDAKQATVMAVWPLSWWGKVRQIFAAIFGAA